MKIPKIGSPAILVLIGILSSFKSGPSDYYWFYPSSTTYVTGSVISPNPQDEIDRLNTASSSNAYGSFYGSVAEEGFLGIQVDESINPDTHPYPTKEDPGALPDAKIYFHE